jgi:hypothetical protein
MTKIKQNTENCLQIYALHTNKRVIDKMCGKTNDLCLFRQLKYIILAMVLTSNDYWIIQSFSTSKYLRISKSEYKITICINNNN